MYISIDTVKQNAQEYQVSFTHELMRVMVHGVLHLCGYGDKTEEQQKQMRAAEDKYLNFAEA
jgi:rRNA maturation RNase YbeY